MLLRISRRIAILFFAAMMFIAGVSANADRQTQDSKKRSEPATKLIQRNSRRSPKPINQPLFQPVQDKDGRGAFKPNGAIGHTLTVASLNPASGVSITVRPLDNNGQGSGDTPFTRSYYDNTVVTLTAPPTAGGNNFQKWQQDGLDFATSLTIDVTMDFTHTMTAVYVVQGSCESPYNLTAGQVFNGNTSGGQSTFGSYNCAMRNEDGPERVHRITLGSAGTITATLTNLAGIDLDVFILLSCSSSSCLAFGDNEAVAGLVPGTYYILVDGFNGAIGDYTLTVGVSEHRATVGLYNPDNAGFYLRNSNTTGDADITFTYGPAGEGWIPLSGDWDGNGTDTIGLYNAADGIFYLRNSNSIGFANITFSYGPPGQSWIPLTGDWNGDGVDTIGLYNPANGTFYLRNSNTVGVADITFLYGPVGQGWIPLAGDWDGDGVDSVGFVQPVRQRVLLEELKHSW